MKKMNPALGRIVELILEVFGEFGIKKDLAD